MMCQLYNVQWLGQQSMDTQDMLATRKNKKGKNLEEGEIKKKFVNIMEISMPSSYILSRMKCLLLSRENSGEDLKSIKKEFLKYVFLLSIFMFCL